MSNRLRRACAALAVTVLAGSASVAFAGPAAAEGPTSFSITGHGFGHGRGLGQWGARGYADNAGWTTGQILDHFYGGTSAGQRDPGQGIRVLLCDQEGVTICSGGQGVGQVTITSGAPFTIEGIVLPGGTALRMTRQASNFKVEQAPGGCGATAWTPVGGGTSVDATMDVDSTVGNPGDDKTQMPEVCGPKRRTYRGVIDYTMLVGKARLVNFLGIDGYLKGVVPSEMPSGWNPAALRAQAVAARSYALAGDNRFTGADTCDTTQCQVYLGASNEKATTNDAINATAGQVRIRNSNGTIARTEFSSSTGGHTAGGEFPAVPDAGDAHPDNPHKNWSTTLQSSTVESAYPSIGDLQRIDVLERNGLGVDGGRVVKVRLVGSSANQDLSGDAFRSKFSLKSDWFTATPVAGGGGGGGGGGGPRALGWLTRSSATPGAPTGNVAYGVEGYTPIACDWDGNGTDTLGVYADGQWYLRNDLNPGSPAISVSYGAPGYTPVCGDWNGDGRDTIGVYVNGEWYLRNENTPGSPQIAFSYGYAAAKPVVGNWAADTADEIGVYDAGTWLLRTNVGAGPPEGQIAYGYAAAQPVVGDWDGNGSDGLGVYDSGTWMLRETTTGGPPQRQFAYGYPGPRPITGQWVAGRDGVGIIELR